MSPYTHVYYDEPMYCSSMVSTNPQSSQDVYGSYGTPVASTIPVMTSNAGAWIDGDSSNVDSPSASMSMVGAQFMDAHEFSCIMNQPTTTGLAQSQIQASRTPHGVQQSPEVLHPGKLNSGIIEKYVANPYRI
jgi:hypothetical protein